MPYARAAWKFLNRAGFINFGTSHSVQERVDKPADKGRIIVVGAGLAGASKCVTSSSGWKICSLAHAVLVGLHE